MDWQLELDLQPQLCRNSIIAVLDDPEVVLVETIGAAAPRTELTRRTRIPLHISATGRCLLAYLEPPDRLARIERLWLSLATSRAAQSREALLGELELIRQRGFAISDREVGPRTSAVAAPILSRSGAILAAIGLVVDPATTSLEELISTYAPRVVSIAERVSLALRYRS